MEFEHAPLRQRDQRRHRVSGHVRRLAATLRNDNACHRGIDALGLVLLIEALAAPAVGTANETQRTVRHVRQYPFTDAFVIAREVLLGEVGFGIEQLFRMRQLYPGDGVGGRGGGFRFREISADRLWQRCERGFGRRRFGLRGLFGFDRFFRFGRFLGGLAHCAGGRGPGFMHGTFPHYFGRVLVFPQSLERRVAQGAVLCPLGEGDLGHQLRLDPMHTLGLEAPRRVDERTRALRQAVELVSQRRQYFVVEPCSHLA